MYRNRLYSVVATLVLLLAIGAGAAPAQAQQGQQGQQAQQGQQGQQAQAAEIERLRRELDQVRQQQGQPLLVVPSMQPPPPVAARIDLEQPMVELAPLLQRVERESGKRFLVDRRHGPRIYLGSVDADDVTYPVLLAIFRINGFGAFESDGYVNVVPDAFIRFHAPVVQTDDASIPADLYVTRVLTTVNANTAGLVPILRPLLSQAAHLAAHLDTNQLVVADRYENVKRITEIVRSLDVPQRASPAR